MLLLIAMFTPEYILIIKYFIAYYLYYTKTLDLLDYISNKW